MQNFMNMSVKEVIEKNPRIGEILEEYHIGCVPCTVATCLLRDVVTIHNLPGKDEAMLMYRMEKELYPERNVQLREVAEGKEKEEFKFSPPMQELVDEHVHIKQLVAYISEVLELVAQDEDIDRDLLFNVIRFIREYADRYHHAKEEDILFEYTDRSLEIINVIMEDHVTARGHIQAVVDAIDTGNREEIISHLTAYQALLTEHITKEDEILFPWIDRGLTTSQVGEIYRKFSEADAELGSDLPRRNLEFLRTLNEKFASQ
ncbi:MAG: hemerythrin domain-containing protein [bacterium]|nr:MAG: hemerythrin domain-containing protein [bacterium]